MRNRIGTRASLAVLAALAIAHGVAAESRAAFNNDLLVTDILTGKFLAFDPVTGANSGTFGGSPNLTSPRGIAIGPDGNIYVGDAQNNGVQEFDGATGAFLKTFVPNGDHGLSYVYGLTFDPVGNLYVAGTGANVVNEYRPDGSFLRAFGAGSPLSSPTGIAIGPDGNLYVASSLTDQILRYNTSTGTYLGQFGPPVQQVSGLAFGNGKLYVASGKPGSNAFGILNASDGSFLSSTNDTAHLLTPGGLVVGPDTKLYIASLGNGDVVRYNADGTFDRTFVTGSSVGLQGPIYLALAPVPEPSSVVLLGVGALGLAVVSLRRKPCDAD